MLAFVLGLLVVLLVVVVASCDKQRKGVVYVKLRAPLPTPARLEPQERKEDVRPSRMSASGFALIPLRYSQPDYGYVAKVRIGDDHSLVVLDTGSSKLAVASDNCVERKLCSAKDAGYDPGTSPTARPTGKTQTLAFATLTIDAELVHDRVSLLPIPGRHALSRFAKKPRLDGPREELVIGEQFPVYAAKSMSGTRSNVMGFTPAEDPSCVFSSAVRAAGSPSRRWSLACYRDGSAWMCIGAPIRGWYRKLLDECGRVPFSTRMSYADTYIVDVKSTRVEGRRSDIGGPDFLVVDTGTADSYLLNCQCETWGLPRSNVVYPKSRARKFPTVQFTLPGGHKIELGPNRYMKKQEGGFVTTLHAGDERIGKVFPGGQKILLLGIEHIHGLVLDFDVDAKTLGIGRC